MRKIITLIQYYFKKSMNTRGYSDSKSSKKTILKTIGKVVLAIIILAYIAGFPFVMVNEYVKKINDIENIYTTFFTLVIGLGVILSMLYEIGDAITRESSNNETRTLRSLPISAREHLFARTISKTATTTGILFLFSLSINIAISVFAKLPFNITFLAVSTLFSIVVPFLFAVVFDIVANILMYVLSFLFSKATTEMVLTILIILISVTMSNASNNSNGGMETMISKANNVSLFSIIAKDFTNLLKGKEVLLSLAKILGIYIAVPSIIIYTFAGIVEKIRNMLADMGKKEVGIAKYIGRYTGKAEKEKEKLEEQRKTGYYNMLTKRNAKKEYLRNETQIFKSNPSLILNTILPTIILPVVMIASFYGSFTNEMKRNVDKYTNYEITNIKTGKVDKYNFYDKFLKDETKSKEEFEKELNEYIEEISESDIQRKAEEYAMNNQKEASDYILAKGKEKLSPETYVVLEKLTSIENAEEANEKIGNIPQEQLKELQEFQLESKKYIKEFYLEKTDSKDDSKYSSEDIEKLKKDLADAFDMIKSKEYLKYIKTGLPKDMLSKELLFKVGIGLMIIAITVTSTEYVSMIAISKHKNEKDTLKRLPISYEKQYDMMTKVPIVITLAVYFMYIIIAAVLLRESILCLEIIAPVLVGILMIIAIERANVYFDLKSPNFSWTNEKELTSKGRKSIIFSIIKMFMMMGSIFLLIFALTSNKEALVLIIFTALAVLLNILIRYFEKKNVYNYFKRL